MVMSKSMSASLSTIHVLIRTWNIWVLAEEKGPMSIHQVLDKMTCYFGKCWLDGHQGPPLQSTQVLAPNLLDEFRQLVRQWTKVVSIAHSSPWSSSSFWARTSTTKGWFFFFLIPNAHESIPIELHNFVPRKPIWNPLNIQVPTKMCVGYLTTILWW